VRPFSPNLLINGGDIAWADPKQKEIFSSPTLHATSETKNEMQNSLIRFNALVDPAGLPQVPVKLKIQVDSNLLRG